MELIITQKAKEVIKQWKSPHHKYLWLYWDTEDCG
ncbi:iron-sulfur cluster biosynthesis family protein [Aquibacillus sp. 3ASR75-54]|uniref:Iron-sulfur cluster biosynthesis family protein n=1 Tax=Aquibacillus salsiterrae TaxID=2950439 RepID=A0A9X3WDI1_9BACI|nr:iron-sulfur cluster biosynthesis family protein [Aquibacillus salsiterrae]